MFRSWVSETDILHSNFYWQCRGEGWVRYRIVFDSICHCGLLENLVDTMKSSQSSMNGGHGLKSDDHGRDEGAEVQDEGDKLCEAQRAGCNPNTSKAEDDKKGKVCPEKQDRRSHRVPGCSTQSRSPCPHGSRDKTISLFRPHTGGDHRDKAAEDPIKIC